MLAGVTQVRVGDSADSTTVHTCCPLAKGEMSVISLLHPIIGAVFEGEALCVS